MHNRPLPSTRAPLRRALFAAVVWAGGLAAGIMAVPGPSTALDPLPAAIALDPPADPLDPLPAAIALDPPADPLDQPAAPIILAAPPLLTSTPLTAQRPSASRDTTPAAPAADSLRVYLLTFGPGAAVWERFGHNALWIHDPAAGSDVAYHYGLFDMSEEGFLLHFLQGRMWYSMGTAPAGWMIDAYRRYGRDVTVQELRLAPDQIRRLQTFLEWNMLPENRVYRYDYFRDNCSTRIRDALDRVMEGALQEELSRRPSPVTYRGQAVALTAEDRLLTTGMDVGLGPLADRPITRWELAFIPMRLGDDLRTITVERDGRALPLVVSERHLPALQGDEPDLAAPPSQTAPPTRAPGLLLLGLIVGGVMAGAGWLARPGQSAPGERSSPSGRSAAGRVVAARWVLTVAGTLWALVTGVLGTVLLALWTLTDHEFAWRNENLLQANPLALALVVLVPLAVIGGRRRDTAGVAEATAGGPAGPRRAARALAAALAALSVLGLLVHPLPLTPQGNLPVIALTLPIHLGLAWALWTATRKEPNR